MKVLDESGTSKNLLDIKSGADFADISDSSDVEQRKSVHSATKAKKKRRSNEECSVNTDVVRSISEYKQRRLKHDANKKCVLTYGKLKTEGLLSVYCELDENHPDRAWLKEEVFLRTFFLIPYVFKRHYSLPLDVFDDAIMNMSQMVLVAIDKYKPGKGASFSNYLYGPFKAAVAKTLHDTNVVAIPPARRKLLRIAMEKANEDGESLADYTGILPDIPISCDGSYEAHDSNVDYEEEIHKIELVEWLEEAISREHGVLTHDERRLLIMHYGLFGHPCVAYKEIARIRQEEGKGCAHSRLSQIHLQAIEKLRDRFAQLGIEEW